MGWRLAGALLLALLALYGSLGACEKQKQPLISHSVNTLTHAITGPDMSTPHAPIPNYITLPFTHTCSLIRHRTSPWVCVRSPFPMHGTWRNVGHVPAFERTRTRYLRLHIMHGVWARPSVPLVRAWRGTSHTSPRARGANISCHGKRDGGRCAVRRIRWGRRRPFMIIAMHGRSARVGPI